MRRVCLLLILSLVCSETFAARPSNPGRGKGRGKAKNTVVTTQPEIYHVSSSAGDDANAGTEASPWRTLGALSSRPFRAGDVIRLRRGDVWTGEALTLQGSSSPPNWITLEDYGTGALPRVSPGLGHDYAIRAQAGWKIRNLELSDAKNGVVLYRSSASASNGLWLENLYIHDLGRSTPLPLGSALPCGGNVLNYDFMPHYYGIYVVSLADRLGPITIVDSLIERVDGFVRVRLAQDVHIARLHARQSYKAGVLFEEVVNGGQVLLEDSIIEHTAGGANNDGDGFCWGTAGLQYNVVENAVVEDVEIAYTRTPNNSPDGVAVDYEGSNRDVVTRRLQMHHNDGSAFLVYANPSWGTDNVRPRIEECSAWSNGLDGPSWVPAFLRHYYNQSTGGVISGNVITRQSGQCLNWVDVMGCTDAWPAGHDITNNTVN